MEALKKFRKLIDTKYRDGGWLPSSRIMCERLGISSVTYVKVTNLLSAENIIKSYPRKGIYVIPEKFRINKIGVVVGSGEESPFLGEWGLVAAILQRIDECGYAPHMIQASPVTNIPRSAFSHYVNSLIWSCPREASVPVLVDMHENGMLPVVAVTPLTPITGDDLITGFPTVSEDYSKVGPQMAEMFIERGHKKIIYAGSWWFAEYSGLAARLNEAGVKFDEACCLGNCDLEPGVLTAALQKHNATGLLFEGRTSRLENAFQEMSDMPESKRPDLLLRKSAQLPELYAQYPGMKVIGIAYREIKELGPAAINLLNEHLLTGEKLESKRISTYKIIRDIKSLIKKEIVA